MRKVYIISAVRTPIGRFGGALKKHTSVDLAVPVMKEALKRAKVNGDDLDLYIFGNVLRAGQGQLVPRQAALKAGIPDDIDGFAVDMVCSSGMMSVMNAATFIKSGETDVMLAGGTESMSNAGYYLSAGARWGYKYSMGPADGIMDILFQDGLSDPLSGEAMGDQTERLASEFGVTREDLDEIAEMSNRRAAEATEKGFYKEEMVPLEYRERRETKTLDYDEGIRSDTTRASLAKLRPAFKKDGVLTAGNSSQISDGASALVLASEAAVNKYGLKPIAEYLGGAWAAGPSWRFPEAPIPAVKRLLERLGLTLDDIGLIENNEAFALNSVLLKKLLGVSYDKLNVHGGGIALGHPIGCTGARITTTLTHALHRFDKKYGLASICHGTGGGTALVIERV